MRGAGIVAIRFQFKSITICQIPHVQIGLVITYLCKQSIKCCWERDSSLPNIPLSRSLKPLKIINFNDLSIPVSKHVLTSASRYLSECFSFLLLREAQ